MDLDTIVTSAFDRLHPEALLKAAAVTEKASRVAPLVNSWKFQDREMLSLVADFTVACGMRDEQL